MRISTARATATITAITVDVIVVPATALAANTTTTRAITAITITIGIINPVIVTWALRSPRRYNRAPRHLLHRHRRAQQALQRTAVNTLNGQGDTAIAVPAATSSITRRSG